MPGMHWPARDPLSWNQNVLVDPILAMGSLGNVVAPPKNMFLLW